MLVVVMNKQHVYIRQMVIGSVLQLHLKYFLE